MEKNAWRVSEELAERIDGAPVLGEFIEDWRPLHLKIGIFFKQAYVKEYQHATAGNMPSVPGYHYLQKLEVFMQKHVQLGELLLKLNIT